MSALARNVGRVSALLRDQGLTHDAHRAIQRFLWDQYLFPWSAPADEIAALKNGASQLRSLSGASSAVSAITASLDALGTETPSPSKLLGAAVHEAAAELWSNLSQAARRRLESEGPTPEMGTVLLLSHDGSSDSVSRARWASIVTSLGPALRRLVAIGEPTTRSIGDRCVVHAIHSGVLSLWTNEGSRSAHQLHLFPLGRVQSFKWACAPEDLLPANILSSLSSDGASQPATTWYVHRKEHELRETGSVCEIELLPRRIAIASQFVDPAALADDTDARQAEDVEWVRAIKREAAVGARRDAVLDEDRSAYDVRVTLPEDGKWRPLGDIFEGDVLILREKLDAPLEVATLSNLESSDTSSMAKSGRLLLMTAPHTQWRREHLDARSLPPTTTHWKRSLAAALGNPARSQQLTASLRQKEPTFPLHRLPAYQLDGETLAPQDDRLFRLLLATLGMDSARQDLALAEIASLRTESLVEGRALSRRFLDAGVRLLQSDAVRALLPRLLTESTVPLPHLREHGGGDSRAIISDNVALHRILDVSIRVNNGEA